MDGKGQWTDNVFIERLWRSLKYECVYLQAFDGFRQARDGIGAWVTQRKTSRVESGSIVMNSGFHLNLAAKLSSVWGPLLCCSQTVQDKAEA